MPISGPGNIPNYVLLLIFVLLHSHFTWVVPDLLIRKINVSILLFVICFQSVWRMMHVADAEMKQVIRPVVFVLAAYGSISVLRIAIDLAMPPERDLLLSGGYDTAVILAYQMLLIAMTLALFLAVNRRLLADLEKDIGSRKMTEEKLRESEEKYRSIFERSVNGIFQNTLDGKFLSVNPAVAGMFGYESPQEMIETVVDIGRELYVNPSDREHLMEAIKRRGRMEGYEVELVRRDCSRFWGSINIYAAHDETGKIPVYRGYAGRCHRAQTGGRKNPGKRNKLPHVL